MQQIDFAILNWIHLHLLNPICTFALRGVTYFGEFGIGWIVIAAVLLCFRRTRRTGITMGIALLLGFLFGEVLLKNLVQRERPYLAESGIQLLIFTPFGYSFPSGHTTSSFAAALSLFFDHRRWGIAALAFAAVMGFSRLYFFVHYPSDVVAGMCLGLICALISRAITRRLFPLLSKKEQGWLAF